MSTTLDLTDEAIEAIARACHEVNRAYCWLLGDDSQRGWEYADDWQKQSAIDGVRYRLKHPDAEPRAMHDNWLRGKLADGWTWGETKDKYSKKHPCMCLYEDLPHEQKLKDTLFSATVDAL